MTSAGALEDLGERWARARRAALRSVAGERKGEEDDALAARAFEVDALEAARVMFDNSLLLGKGFRRHHGPVPFAELGRALEALGGPCLRGRWQAHPREAAFVLERGPCHGGCEAVCDAWREALDGLVLGVSGEGRATRHRSGGHGDGACVDVIYLDPESLLRFGFIPDELREGLDAVARFLNGLKGTRVRFLGVSEGVLAYELEVDGCGGTEAVTALLTRAVAARWPALRVRDVSPRSPFERPESPPVLEVP
ncbi:MAG: hypothetical protein JNJ54_21185 [Myxococcaceae bacterium]|nr:hypothetical protein [Myxococcaceae bacterium]